VHRGVKHFLGFLFLSVISVALLLFEHGQSRRPHPHATSTRQWATAAFTPITRVSEETLDSLKDLYNRIRSSDTLWDENRRLTSEVHRLQTALQLSREKTLQLNRLVSLTSDTVVAVHYERIIPAEILAFRVTPLSSVIVVDKGSEDGVTVNSTVAHGKNLVGQVISTSRTSSVIQVLNDPKSVVSGIVCDVRQLCLVKSQGPNKPLRLMMERTTFRLKENDLVISSGINTSIYPKGLIIGTITKVERNPRGEVTADLTPAVDFTTIEEVMIIPASPLQDVAKISE